MELWSSLELSSSWTWLAYFFGYDSREASALDHHDRALEAVRRGQFDVYSHELAQIERKMLKDSWPGF